MRLWLSALVVTAALAAPAAAQAQGVPGLEFVAPDKLSVALEDGKADKSVWVRNTTEKPADLTFSTLLEDSDGKPKSVVVNPLPASLPAGDEQRIRLTFSTKKQVDGATGELMVSGAGAPGSLELSVSKKTIVDRGVKDALLIPLVLATLIVVGLAFITVPNREHKWAPLPSSIDFKTSFASGLTAAGAILGTILTASVLPEEPASLSKEGFAALNLIFGIAIAVAAFVYAAMQPPGWGKKDEATNTQSLELTGSALGYLIASFITVWATLGELMLTSQLLNELGSSKGFDASAKYALGILLLIAFLLLGLYVWRRFFVVFSDPRPATTATPSDVKRFGPRRIVPHPQPGPPSRSVPLL